MNYAVYFVSILLIFSKLLDCLSTAKMISNISNEANPLANVMMRAFGIRPVIWLYFILALAIVFVSGYYVIVSQSMLNMILFILVGLFISAVQFATAHNNYTGRMNFITKRLHHIIMLVRIR